MKTAAIILAAGSSIRMGETNKLTTEFRGKPMVRFAVEAAVASGVTETVVVVGHEADSVRVSLEGLNVIFVENADYASGLSSSLKTGIETLNESIDRALVLLGDMPLITTEMIDRMLTAGDAAEGKIVLATSNGQRGNPVLWPRECFGHILMLSGDAGARELFARYFDRLAEVELGEAAQTDVDTPEELSELRDR